MGETSPSLREDRLRNDRPDSLLVLLVAFLFPGAGHALLGRLWKGVGFFVIIGSMFVTGLLLEGKLYEFDSSRPVTIAATIASIGSGAFDLSARLHGWSGDRRSGTHEYGTVFILTAGVMNLLLLFDLWDLLFAEEAENEEDPEIVGESR